MGEPTKGNKERWQIFSILLLVRRMNHDPLFQNLYRNFGLLFTLARLFFGITTFGRISAQLYQVTNDVTYFEEQKIK